MLSEKYRFFIKIPIISKLVLSSLVYFGITLIYSNLTWVDLRSKIPVFNRMFYVKALSIHEQYKEYSKKKDEQKAFNESDVLSVETLSIESELLTPIMTYSAVLEPLERVDVYSKVSGRVEHFFVREGEVVKKGQKLAKLDSMTFELDLAKQKASNESALALYQLSKDKYDIAKRNIEVKLGEADKRIGLYQKAIFEEERFQEIFHKKENLWTEKAISEEEIENLKLELASRKLITSNARRDLEMILIGIRDEDIVSAGYSIPNTKKEKIELLKIINTRIEKSELEVASTQLKASEVNLKATEMLIKESVLISPINGIVAKINRTAGELINAGSGGSLPILTLISNKGAYVSFAVNEGDLGKIKQGQLTKINVDSLPNRNFKGVLKRISPLIDQKTHTAEAKVELIALSSELKPGMFVRAELIVGEDEKTILIPVSALASIDNTEGSVYVIKSNKAFKKQVILGERREERITIKEGLLENDVVVVSSINRLYDGISVIPKFQ